MKTLKRAVLVLLALCMVVPAGCRKSGTSSGSDEWEYVYTSETVDGEVTSKDKTASKEKTPKKSGGSKTETITEYKKKGNVKVDYANVGKDPDAKYDIATKKGQPLVVAVSSYRPSDYEAVLDAFQQVYKNVEISIDYRPNNGGDNDECLKYLTMRAASGNMPDVVYDDAGKLWSYVQQGWVEPLDNYVKNDASWKYVPTERVKDCQYHGVTYAIPYKAHFSAFVLNLDTLEHFNLKEPALTWNVDDFTYYLKAAANEEYSGAEILLTLPSYMSGAYDPTVGNGGYDVRARNYDKMTGSYGKARKLWQQLIAYPNLESYQLVINSNGADYTAKFGLDWNNNRAGSFHAGKTLLHEDQGTWSYEFIDSTCNFDWELRPYPQCFPGVVPLHVDTCFMLKSSKQKDVAFQFLRYCTYSTEGLMATLSQYDANNKSIYKPASRLMYPISTAPEVTAKFKSLPQADDLDLFWFEHIKDGYRADLIKIQPDSQTIGAAISAYVEGKDNADVDSLMPGLQAQANKVCAEVWANFDAQYAKNNK